MENKFESLFYGVCQAIEDAPCKPEYETDRACDMSDDLGDHAESGTDVINVYYSNGARAKITIEFELPSA